MIMVKRAGSPLVPLLDGYMSWCIANAQGLYALLAYAKPTSGSLTIMFRKLIRPSNSEDDAITAAAPQEANNPPFSDAYIAALRPRRGRPPKARPKLKVSIRSSADVKEFINQSEHRRVGKECVSTCRSRA